MKTPCYMRQKLPVVLVAGLGGFFTVVDVACAQPWAATTAPRLSWKALASSADGTRLVAAANTRGGYFAAPPAPIYVSTNAGASWTQTSTPSNNWSSVACSADGMKLVAASTPYQAWDGTNWGYDGGGAIYRSPDSGSTWMRTSAPTNYWTSVASSADGARLVAVAAPLWVYGTNYEYVSDGAIYSSLDSGATWSRTSAPTNYWTSVASSAAGTKLVAVAALLQDRSGNPGSGQIYTSSNSGASWAPTTAPSNNWTSVACSVDGTKLVAAAVPYWDVDGNPAGECAIYRSLDSGATWMRTSAPSNTWSCVRSSAEGTKLVASTDSYYGRDGLIYTSDNSGVTWTATGAPRGWWTAVASSADGYRVVAGGGPADPWGPGPLCTLPYSGPWRLADAPPNDWRSVASSADGAKLVAVARTDSYGGDGLIYTSSNSGATWTPTSAPSNNWVSVGSSADGTILVAVASADSYYGGDGLIYTSSNSGVTWTPTSAPTNSWVSVASSADGIKLFAVAYQMIYTSSNSGATWAPTSAPTNYWNSIASSGDGTKLVAVASAEPYYGGDGLIYTSSDSGATWAQTGAPTNYWTSVASSGDGTKLVAAVYQNPSFNPGQIYTSSNSGVAWTPTSAPINYWTSVASSADGTKLVAVCSWPDPGSIYISTNSGATWTPGGGPAVGSWQAVASSADGSNIVASGDRICTLRSPAPTPPLPPSPQLAVGLSGANLGLSWLVPSSRFVLQQNSDLGSTNWVDMPASPTLDYTNLHHRLTLTPSLGSSFYRLKQQ